jgi:alpha-1,4-digalacturonate transport system permease protein
MLHDRWFVGSHNFETLLDCGSFLDPNSCATDLFWRGIHNTFTYVFFEVAGILLFSLLTALILNRRIVARGRRTYLALGFATRGCA